MEAIAFKKEDQYREQIIISTFILLTDRSENSTINGVCPFSVQFFFLSTLNFEQFDSAKIFVLIIINVYKACFEA